MMKSVYMEVTMDEFELPLAVADSAYELAMICKTNVLNVYHGCKRPRSKWRRVWIKLEEDEHGPGTQSP